MRNMYDFIVYIKYNFNNIQVFSGFNNKNVKLKFIRNTVINLHLYQDLFELCEKDRVYR